MLKNRPSVTGWKAVHKTFAGVAAYISVASARAEICVQDASAIDPVVCDGLDPKFETPSSTASGFTVQVSNYDGSYSWLVSTTVGSATISGTGLITVTGLATAEGATVTVFTSKMNHTSQQADVSGSALSVSTTTISSTGLVTVTGLAPGESATVTVVTTRTGYNAGTADVSGSALTGSALPPTFATPKTTADGFTVQVSNYDANFTWSLNTTAGSATISDKGLVTVTGLAPGESATVTVVTTRTGYNASTASASASSVAMPPTPVPMLPIWGVAALSGMLTVLAKQLKKK